MARAGPGSGVGGGGHRAPVAEVDRASRLAAPAGRVRLPLLRSVIDFFFPSFSSKLLPGRG